MVQDGVRFYFPIHDEVVWSVHRDKAVAVSRIVHECMTQPYSTLPVPILGSISLGPSFGVQIECGEEFDAEKIERAVEEALSKVRVNRSEEVCVS